MSWLPSVPLLARTLRKLARPRTGVDLKKPSSLTIQPSDPAAKFPHRLLAPKRDEPSRRALPVSR
jgi:hypothetical protein